MKRYYCTYFNIGYLDRALVLLESIQKFSSDYVLHILCFDDDTYLYFKNCSCDCIQLQRLEEFESRNVDVAATKQSRSRGEYFFTCTSAWILDVLVRNPDIDILTYLDADLCFFSSPEPLFIDFNKKDILITEHKFSAKKKNLLRYGRFNVGWLSFRNNLIGLTCLKRWRSQCVTWCYDRLEENKFADQKYLDEWPDLFGNHLMIGSAGLNAGPWSLDCRTLIRNGEGKLYLDGCPLITYHYQGLRLYSYYHFYIGYIFEHSPVRALRWLYFPYVCNLIKHQIRIDATTEAHPRYKREKIYIRMFMGYWLNYEILSFCIWSIQKMIIMIVRRKYLLKLIGR